jgi:hypothetical protein
LLSDYATKPADISDTVWCLEWGKAHGSLSVNSVRSQISAARCDGRVRQRIHESTYPVYNNPLTLEGDALVLPDLEMPFHSADFVNRCLDLADKWNIKQAILAGDVLHFDSLSGWEPAWTNDNPGGLTADAESALMQFAKTLPAKRQGEMMGLIGDIGQKSEQDGVSTELSVARRELKRLAEQFDRIDFVLGNHCGRLLRAMGTAMNPKELLRLLETDDKWRIAEYYFSYLDTVNGRFQIEHPKNAGKFSASKLSSKYLCHIIMAHSHQLNFTFDPSGKYYAVEAGCCVDENRLPYCSQRHNISPSHILGAVIIKDGYPYLLHKGTNWDHLSKWKP